MSLAQIAGARATGRKVGTAAAIGAVGALYSSLSHLINLPAEPDQAGFAAWNIVNILAWPLLMMGLAGLAGSGLVGDGWLGRIGLTLTALGLVLFTFAEITVRWWASAGSALHPIAEPLLGIGMILTGTAVLRAQRWTGWHRFTPLLAGLAPFVIDVPGLVLFGPDSRAFQYCLATFWATWLAMFLALRAAMGTADDVTVAGARPVWS